MSTKLAADQILEQYLTPAPVLAVISGPSGVGKDSVVKRLRQSDNAFQFVVTCTSRAPRHGEVEGEDYYFVSRQEFEQMIQAGDLLEYALVYGQYKGNQRSRIREALATSADVIMRLDVQGAATIKRLVPGAVTIFIAPPSREVLWQRLQGRGTDSSDQVQCRIDTAMHELDQAPTFDYVVINHEGRLDQTVETVKAIIIANKYRTGRQPVIV
ncbi:MAG: guanylate kinase [Anaerolineae bacterium]